MRLVTVHRGSTMLSRSVSCVVPGRSRGVVVRAAAAEPPAGGQRGKRATNSTNSSKPQPGKPVAGSRTTAGSQTNVTSYQVVNEAAQDLVVGAADVATNVTDTTANTAGDAADTVAATAQTAAGTVDSVSKSASSTVRGVADAVADAFDATAGAVSSVAGDAADVVTQAAADAADQLTVNTAGAMGAMVEGVASAAEAAVTEADRMVFAEAAMGGSPTPSSSSSSAGAYSAAARSSYNAPNKGAGKTGVVSNIGASSSSGAGAGVGGGRSYSPPPTDPGLRTMEADEDEVAALQLKLLAAVSSLDRGLAANMKESREVDALSAQLEALVGPVSLDWKTSRSRPDDSSMDLLAGTWRLIYSSGFNNGSLGGSRPGPPAAFVPLILGQVYQVINTRQERLDNVVELLASFGLPRLPFLGGGEPQPTPGLRVTLGHSCSMTGAGEVRIVYDATEVAAIGPDLVQRLPQLQVPELPEFLRPPANMRSATFRVSFLDDSMRITRGDRGELRIYLRDEDLVPMAPNDYMD